MPRDITFEAIKLLSQRIVSNLDKIPEGEIFQKTSCMNPDDAELLGFILAIKQLRPEKAERLKKIITLLETIGIAKWQKGELTHLGFRAGLRYQEVTDVAKDSEVPVTENVIDESGLKNADSSSE